MPEEWPKKQQKDKKKKKKKEILGRKERVEKGYHENYAAVKMSELELPLQSIRS